MLAACLTAAVITSATTAGAAVILTGGGMRLAAYAGDQGAGDIRDQRFGLDGRPDYELAFDNSHVSATNDVWASVDAPVQGRFQFSSEGISAQTDGGVTFTILEMILTFNVSGSSDFSYNLSRFIGTASRPGYHGNPQAYVPNLSAGLSGPSGRQLMVTNHGYTDAVGQQTITLAEGSYEFGIHLGYLENSGQANIIQHAFDLIIDLPGAVTAPGFSSSNPILSPDPPVIVGDGTPVFTFPDVPSGMWFDPPASDGFIYEMTDGALFTNILGFPPGFNNDFEVLVGTTSLGLFGPGDGVDFVSLLGSGVSSFRIMGIDPLIDGADPSAFPIQLAFDQPTASFTMQATAVPEPASGLAVVVTIAVASMRRRKFAAA